MLAGVLLVVLVVLALPACQSPALTAAKLYLKQDDPERAEQQLTIALHRDPRNAEAHFLLGLIAAQQGRYAAMDSAFTFAWELGETYRAQIAAVRHQHWVRAHNRGVACLGAQPPEYAAAVRAFGQAIAIDSRPLAAWHRIAAAYCGLDSLAAAAAIYRHVLASVPDDTVAMAGLGTAALRLGWNAEADRVLERLCASAPASPAAHTNRGIALERLGRVAQAECSYRRAAALSPPNALAHYDLGNLLWKQGRFGEAEAEYRRALELGPDDADTRHNLAVTYLSQNRPEQALPLLRQLAAERPLDARLWRQLGRLQAAAGDSAASRAALARADSLAAP
jgi:tetratricopeptide (TPR) repeat protein